MSKLMIIYKNEFEKEHNDTIAVIYQLLKSISFRDGIESSKRKVVKLNPLYNNWMLFNDCEYLIICGQSEYHIKNGKLIQTYPTLKK